jgi:2-isopropylmalate synthase
MRQIKIFDTTLRDGEQTPGVNLNLAEKIQIARQLAILGIDVIEAGFPIASPGDFESVRAISCEVEGPTIAGLARAVPGDIQRAAKALEGGKNVRIHTFVATSPIHMKYKFRKKPNEILKMAVEAVELAKNLCPEVEFSAEDATRSEWPFLAEVLAAVIEAGADVVNIPDTVGYTFPEEYGRLISYLRDHVPGIDKVEISVHCHNDLGMAVANSLTAVRAGATQVEGAINGLGERAGNAAIEEIVMALNTRGDLFDAQTAVKTEHIYRTSRLVSTLSGVVIQPNKAIVGDNAFAHESGIHQDGVLKEASTYEIMRPESIGLTQSKLVLGKHSGRHAIRAKLEELGYKLSSEEMDKAYQRFIEMADKKKEVSVRDLEALVEEGLSEIPETYKLEYLHAITGDKTIPTATVKISKGDHVMEEAACASAGPVEAVFRAIERVVGLNLKLEEYNIRAVTSGQDALGEVTLKVRGNIKSYTGRGTSTDIIEASARAYLQAINKLVAGS